MWMCPLPGDEGGQEGEGEVGGDQRQPGAGVEIVSRVEIVRLVPHCVHTVENLKEEDVIIDIVPS